MLAFAQAGCRAQSVFPFVSTPLPISPMVRPRQPLALRSTRGLIHGLLGLIGLAIVVRAFIYVYYSYSRFFYISSFYYAIEEVPIEAKMVHLAWRAQQGITLYPDWHHYPHVSNFFGPFYFVVVGALGRVFGAELDDLYVIGRTVSLVSGLLTTLLIGLAVRLRYGTTAGWLAMAASLGSRPMYGFSAMVRPDMTAELLGFAGFLLAIARGPRWREFVACILFALAVATKQTAGVFLIGATVALVVSGQIRRGLVLAGATLALLAAGVGVLALSSEPYIVPSLLGESETPWSMTVWIHQVSQLVCIMPDLLVFPVAGFVFWTFVGPRWTEAAALTAIIISVCLLTSAKMGADANYFLNLRIVAAFAVGSFWHAAAQATSVFRIRLILVSTGIVGLIAAVMGILVAAENVNTANTYWDFQNSPLGRTAASDDKVAVGTARDRRVRILTDSGFLDVQQRERTVFGDPWLFRLQVETGSIRPTKIIADLEARRYDFLFTNKDFFQKEYETFDFGLPMAIVEPARRNYKLAGVAVDFYLYKPRDRTEAKQDFPKGR